MVSPLNAAMPYLQQIPGTLHQAYDPYIEQGQRADATTSPIYSQMAADPVGQLSGFESQYRQTPGFQTMLQDALRAAGNTAAAGGQRGGLMDIENQANISNRLEGQDMQRWLQNIFGLQEEGLQGENQFSQRGFNASGQMGSDLSNLSGTEASLAFQDARQHNLNKQAHHAQKVQELMQALGLIGGAATGMMKMPSFQSPPGADGFTDAFLWGV